ncbi:sialin isoform 1-T2 [Glossina fuscipes fuscipes]
MVFITLPKIYVPRRLNVAIMLFMGCFLGYVMRTNLSINIIAMVENTNPNITTPSPDYGPRYNWTQNDQALLLGAYFYGYMLTSIPGGILAENFGGTRVLGYSFLLTGVLTALTPAAAALNKWAVFVLRFSQGFIQGVLYPCCHNLISKWAPPDEKGKFVASLMGGTFGTVITWPASGLIIQALGWHWAFYVAAIVILCGMILWFIFVADNPAKHKTISAEEKQYIEKSLGVNVSNKNRIPPYWSIMKSTPFWGLILLHYGSMWGLFFLLTATPKFLSEVLGFNLSSAGFIASLPHLVRMLGAFVFGSLADWIRRRDWLTVTAMRKIFCIPSHILPGVFLIILAYFGKDPYVCVALMTVSLGFNGAASVTNLQNSQDLAPNYAGTLYGIINFLGTTPGFFSPMLVAAFTEENNAIEQWHWVFIIGGLIYIVPALIFWLIGSGSVQKWNEFEGKEGEKTTMDKI